MKKDANPYASAVAKGAQLLDTLAKKSGIVRPGWRQNVNEATFKMEDPENDILAQVCGKPTPCGVEMLEREFPGFSVRQAPEYGFVVGWPPSAEKFRLLNEAWLQEIQGADLQAA